MVSTLLLYLTVCKFLFVLNVQGNENCSISNAQSNNDWSQCSKTCGQAIKTKMSCTPDCKEITALCNLKPCPGKFRNR